MNRSGKILLALTVLTLAPGLFVELDVVEVSTVPGLYALLPAGVIFLAMFVLDLALGKEMARFDAEERQRNHLPAAADDEPAKHPPAHRPPASKP